MQVYTTETIARYEHGRENFTQGLVVYDERLTIESTGLYGASRLIYRSTTDMSEVAGRPLPRDFFAEGICRGPAGLIVLSWRESVALQWDVESARVVRTFDYDRDGWGICYDGAYYITSDGTDRLTFRAPDDMTPVKELSVRLQTRPLAGLNDLHWSSPGTVWANIDSTDHLAEIDVSTGEIVSLLDGTGLRAAEDPTSDLMNGVAGQRGRHLLLTGKHWSWIHRVILRPLPLSAAELDSVVAGLPRSISDLHEMTPREGMA
jgi:glutaminyl-peptide cyclotransferase